MDGSFACPECGSEVEVRGLAPGPPGAVRVLPPAARGSRICPRGRARLETPSLRAPEVGCVGVGRAERAAGRHPGCGAFQFLRRQYDSIQDRSINRLLDSSRGHEADGRLGEALVDLDAALDLAEKAGPEWSSGIDGERTDDPNSPGATRKQILKHLSRDQSTPFRLGDWLNLIARASRDPDLAAIANEDRRTLSDIRSRTSIGHELAAAGNCFKSGKN